MGIYPWWSIPVDTLIWRLELFWQRLIEGPWVVALCGALSGMVRWMLGTGAPIVGGALVLAAGLIVAKAIRTGPQNSHRAEFVDWLDRASDSAGRWEPTMANAHFRRRARTRQNLFRRERPQKGEQS